MKDRFAEIPARVDTALEILDEILLRLDRFESSILPQLGKTSDSVLIPVQLLENGYTAVETLFLRISQAFENSLEPDRWHTHLLEKMTLQIAGVRPPTITHKTKEQLDELMRFRHFKRYYFQFDYDWRKIDLLIQIFRETVPELRSELAEFTAKLSEAAE